jgi:hypothetical protein
MFHAIESSYIPQPRRSRCELPPLSASMNNISVSDNTTDCHGNHKVLDKHHSCRVCKFAKKSCIRTNSVVLVRTSIDSVKRELAKGSASKILHIVSELEEKSEPIEQKKPPRLLSSLQLHEIKPKVPIFRKSPKRQRSPVNKRRENVFTGGFSSWKNSPASPTDICGFVGNLDI